MKKAGKKRWLIVLAVAAAAAAAVLMLTLGGGRKKPAVQETAAGFTPRLDPKAECPITVAGHYDNFEALEAEFIRFNQYYPNVRLTYVKMDGYDKRDRGILSTALAGGEAPDIFFTYPKMADWPDNDAILAASKNLADPALGIDLSCVRESLLRKEADGSVLSVPVYTTTWGMLVNEDIFAKEKIAVPQTYSELLSACEALKKAGYANPVMGYNRGNGVLYPLYYPYFCALIRGNETALNDLNAMKPEAGGYIRAALALESDFMEHGYIDLEACNELEKDYDPVIMRFFEGDVPMMMTTGNTVSGTEKRQSKSESYTAHPFRYSFYPVPSTEEGGYFINEVSLGFGVNQNSRNPEMVNEFMRFLVSTDELNGMAKAKRLVTPCVDMSLDGMYAAFGKLDAQRIINLSELGLLEAPADQVNKAGKLVSDGLMTVDEAVAAFGSIQ